MIDVTVKTLDSQNKSFSVEEEMTVRQFKEKIADSINISADTQRLIFQGRVMQDEKLLKDYNVHGKVIHVVHRMPPSSRPPSSSPGGATSSHRPPGGRDLNSFVIGSVSVPSDAVDTDEIQNIVQDAISGMGDMGRNARVSTRTSNDGSSVDVHIHLGQGQGQVESESQQRINHARQMLRIAQENLQTLENRQRGSERTDASESSASNGSNATPQRPDPPQQSTEENNDVAMESEESQSSSQSQPQANQNNSQSQQSSQEGTGSSQSGATPEQPRMVRPRISALGEVLNEVHEINRRFQPFLEQYQRLLLDDPELSEQEVQENTQLCNLVGEITHAISHCYHNLSDLMIDLNQARPRHLYAAFISPPVQTTLIHQQTIPVHINASPRQSPRAGRRNTGTQSTVSTSSSSTSTPTPPTNAAGSQTERTSTQSTGTSTGPTFTAGVPQAGATGNPPEGSEPLFQMIDMGPDSVTEISAHVITTERDMPTGSIQVPAASSSGGSMPAIPPDLIQNIVSSVMMGTIDPSGRVQVNLPGSRTYAEAATSTPVTAVPSNTSTSETNSSSTQTNPGQTNSSETQTAASVTNTSGTQTRPRAAAFVVPGLPGGLPPGLPGIPGIGGMGGMRGGVDPYLPCSSRHFLRQQVRNAAGQGAQVQISMPNLMANVMGQLQSQQSGPRTTGTASAMPSSAPRTATSTSSTGGSAPSARVATTSTGSSTSTSGSSSSSGIPPNFQFAQFPGGPGIPSVSIQMGGLPAGIPFPPGMFGAGQIGNMLGNMMGGLGMMRPGAPPGAPATGTRAPPSNRPPPQPQGSTSTPAGGPQTGGGGQQGEPVFVQMLRSMLAGAQQQSGSPTTPSTTASTPVGSTSTSSTSSSASSSTTEPVMTDDVFASLVQGISGIVTRTALGQGPPETISTFLSSLGENHQIVPGEAGFIHDVFNVVSNHLTFPHLIQVFYGSGQPLDQLRGPLQQFFRDRILNGREASAENIVQAVDTLVNDMQEELTETANVSEVKPQINLVETWNNFFRTQLISIITFIMRAESDGGFGQELYNRMRMALSLLIILTQHCLTGGMAGLQALIQNRLQYITRGVNPMIQQWMITVTTQQLNQFLPTITVTETDITTYLVLKKEKKAEEAAKLSPMDTTSPGASQPEAGESKMDVDMSKPEEAAAQPSTSRLVNGNNSSNKKPLTTPKPEPAGAAMSSEGWDREVPAEWVPVINGDVQKQKQQRHQPPFSDAYLNGMPPKRRRLMTQDRPGDLANTPQSLTDQLTEAVRVAGVEPISSMENLRTEASTDTELQSAYEEQVHNAISHRVSHDTDYNKDRFPNTESYFNNDDD
ncbi:large proline-rich protein BAG6-like isoform X3 [Saccostrea echinata]|uniref:large proline-rich protein BAG6-like isoform X3 n=1 Tax=Saccostrea echinata TaxID=191078 RepID=UPI002A7FBF94|nr:large proline-rich protein BAG6-like isoform X3 [Saccostrea echinata]